MRDTELLISLLHNPLKWGVKESFRTYVETAGGNIEPKSPTRAEAGQFVFPFVGSQVAPTGEGEDPFTSAEFQYQGEVWFEAHDGMLAVKIINPHVVAKDKSFWLTAVDTDYLPDRSRRIRIGRLDPASATIDASAGRAEIPVTLTIHGSQLLGDVYPVRTPLDPLIFERKEEHSGARPA